MNSTKTSNNIKNKVNQPSLSTLNSINSDSSLLQNKNNLVSSDIRSLNIDEPNISSEIISYMIKRVRTYASKK